MGVGLPANQAISAANSLGRRTTGGPAQPSAHNPKGSAHRSPGNAAGPNSAHPAHPSARPARFPGCTPIARKGPGRRRSILRFPVLIPRGAGRQMHREPSTPPLHNFSDIAGTGEAIARLGSGLHCRCATTTRRTATETHPNSWNDQALPAMDTRGSKAQALLR